MGALSKELRVLKICHTVLSSRTGFEYTRTSYAQCAGPNRVLHHELGSLPRQRVSRTKLFVFQRHTRCELCTAK
jgi:hypothetical protein